MRWASLELGMITQGWSPLTATQRHSPAVESQDSSGEVGSTVSSPTNLSSKEMKTSTDWSQMLAYEVLMISRRLVVGFVKIELD